jgi:hypothetical protein
LGLVAEPATAKNIVDLYLANTASAQAMADVYQVKLIFAWQPNPYVGKSLSPFELEQTRSFERYCPGVAGMFAAVDAELRSRMDRSPVPGFLDLSRVFEETTEPAYIDFCHLKETANEIIASRLLPAVRERLPGAVRAWEQGAHAPCSTLSAPDCEARPSPPRTGPS